ncbi:MAG: TetR/AcrR family transcriptional regulator C-terminal ligand-binding domain-containing protein [Proteobacteria bacterium]|nr:TetR/AcrR family transcriptional regulator C-terminal ligand-binding domain-containing protein [Pseudomonadota bacterium]
MSTRERVRFGGRSARIQEAVHQAVKDLSARTPRADLTIPMIAAKAGVTPSTIYRRWGDLAELLSDVAVSRLRPIADPADCGSQEADLAAWTEQFMEEMSSDACRGMIRDACANPNDTKQCCGFIQDQLQVIVERAEARGEKPFDLERAMDQIVAPIMYRILFSAKPLDIPYSRQLVADFLK